MFKRLRKEPIAALLVTLLLVVGILGATSWSTVWSRLDRLWVGDTDDTATQTLGDDDVYIKGNVEIDGTLYADGGIGNIVRTNDFNLVGALLIGTGVIGNDGTTAPGLSTSGTDNIPAIVYQSVEAESIGWSFVVPEDYSSGLSFRVWHSSSAAVTDGHQTDWAIWVNKSATVFDAIGHPQTAVALGVLAANLKNVVNTYTPDATALADIAAGNLVTAYFWNNSSGASTGTNEIKAVQWRYTATQ